MRNALKTAVLLARAGRPVHGASAALLGGSTGLVIGLVLGLAVRAAAPTGSATRSRSRRPGRSRSTREELPKVYAIVEELTQRADMPMPKLYVSARDAAQRVRHRPQPEPRGGLRDPGHPPGARRRRAAWCARPRALARAEPRHPHQLGRGRGRARHHLRGQHARCGARMFGGGDDGDGGNAFGAIADGDPRSDRGRAAAGVALAQRASSRPTPAVRTCCTTASPSPGRSRRSRRT